MHHRPAFLTTLVLPILAFGQTPGSIEGVATNRLTKVPVPAVRIHMRAVLDRTVSFDAITDTVGFYRIENVPPGEYSPSFDAPNGFYVPNLLEFVAKDHRIQVTDHAAKFDVEVSPASAIRGSVVDPDGNPVPGATVAAVPIAGIMPGMAKTDERGHYSVPVGAGKYRLQVRRVTDKWPSTYYPGVADPSLAEPITVREGAEVGGYDIRLQPLARHCLRGTVRDTAGEPVPGIEVSVQSYRGLIEQLVKTKSDAHGAFELKPVPPGNWQITATMSRDRVRWFGVTRVTMADRDLDGIDLRIDPPIQVDVEVRGVPEQRPNFLRLELAPVVAPAGDSSTVQSGRARFKTIYPGTYRLGAYGVVPGYYLKSVMLGAQDVTGLPFDLGPASPPLQIVYASNGGRLTGEVENGAGAKVLLIWADHDNYTPGAGAFTLLCSPEGRFTTTGLHPGAWYALAFTNLDATLSDVAIREAVFDRGLWRQAASVTIIEGEVTNLNLKAASWIE